MIDPTKLPQQAPEYDLSELLEAGAHFGHQSRKWHPSMKQYIYMEKDGVHIFDLAKTAEQLKIAYNFAFQLGQQKKVLIIVGTKRQARELIRTAAEDAGCMYITARWLGGLLTNWDQVKKSLKRMLEIEEGLANDSYKGYTKFERVQLDKERGRLDRFFSGIKNLKAKPDALFIIDPGREKNAVDEAVSVGVPVMGLVDSNTDPRALDVAIPANDDALGSIKYIVEAVAAGYKAGRQAKTQ
ncbi:MAG: 30S ribosomal protein S2 [bacterium]|nr:30S ribosomal protein S2 [bacterium]